MSSDPNTTPRATADRAVCESAEKGPEQRPKRILHKGEAPADVSPEAKRLRVEPEEKAVEEGGFEMEAFEEEDQRPKPVSKAIGSDSEEDAAPRNTAGGEGQQTGPASDAEEEEQTGKRRKPAIASDASDDDETQEQKTKRRQAVRLSQRDALDSDSASEESGARKRGTRKSKRLAQRRLHTADEEDGPAEEGPEKAAKPRLGGKAIGSDDEDDDDKRIAKPADLRKGAKQLMDEENGRRRRRTRKSTEEEDSDDEEQAPKGKKKFEFPEFNENEITEFNKEMDMRKGQSADRRDAIDFHFPSAVEYRDLTVECKVGKDGKTPLYLNSKINIHFLLKLIKISQDYPERFEIETARKALYFAEFCVKEKFISLVDVRRGTITKARREEITQRLVANKLTFEHCFVHAKFEKVSDAPLDDAIEIEEARKRDEAEKARLKAEQQEKKTKVAMRMSAWNSHRLESHKDLENKLKAPKLTVSVGEPDVDPDSGAAYLVIEPDFVPQRNTTRGSVQRLALQETIKRKLMKKFGDDKAKLMNAQRAKREELAQPQPPSARVPAAPPPASPAPTAGSPPASPLLRGPLKVDYLAGHAWGTPDGADDALPADFLLAQPTPGHSRASPSSSGRGGPGSGGRVLRKGAADTIPPPLDLVAPTPSKPPERVIEVDIDALDLQDPVHRSAFAEQQPSAAPLGCAPTQLVTPAKASEPPPSQAGCAPTQLVTPAKASEPSEPALSQAGCAPTQLVMPAKVSEPSDPAPSPARGAAQTQGQAQPTPTKGKKKTLLEMMAEMRRQQDLKDTVPTRRKRGVADLDLGEDSEPEESVGQLLADQAEDVEEVVDEEALAERGRVLERKAARMRKRAKFQDLEAEDSDEDGVGELARKKEEELSDEGDLSDLIDDENEEKVNVNRVRRLHQKWMQEQDKAAEAAIESNTFFRRNKADTAGRTLDGVLEGSAELGAVREAKRLAEEQGEESEDSESAAEEWVEETQEAEEDEDAAAERTLVKRGGARAGRASKRVVLNPKVQAEKDRKLGMELLDEEDQDIFLAAVPAHAKASARGPALPRGGFFASATLRTESAGKLASSGGVGGPSAALGARRRVPAAYGPSPTKAVAGSAPASQHKALLGALNQRQAAATRL